MYRTRGCVVIRITAQPLLLIQRFLTPFTKMASDRQGCIGWGLPFPEIFLLKFPPFPEIFLLFIQVYYALLYSFHIMQ